MKSTKWTRRQVLKGAGVALSAPWLETFETKRAQAQTASVRRYMSVYWPLGTADGHERRHSYATDATQPNPRRSRQKRVTPFEPIRRATW